MDEQSQNSRGTEFSCEDALAFIDDSRTVGFAIVDKDSRFVCVNEEYCRILNTIPSRIIGTTYQSWTLPSDIEDDEKAAQELIDGERTEYTFWKTYLPAGSTPRNQLRISGTLEVQAVWKLNAFAYFRVKFTPVTVLQGNARLDITKLKTAIEWLTTNWKTIAVILAVSSSIIFGGSSSLLDMLQRAKEAKRSVDSVLESESSPSLPP